MIETIYEIDELRIYTGIKTASSRRLGSVNRKLTFRVLKTDDALSRVWLQ